MVESDRGRSLTKKKQLAKDQRGLCFYCQLNLHHDLTWEHLVPRSHRGSNKAHNLRIAHGVCNSLAGNMPVTLKLQMHDMAVRLGSDAFFLVASRLAQLPPATLALVGIRRRVRRMKPREYEAMPEELKRAFAESERIVLEMQQNDRFHEQQEASNENYANRPVASWARF